MLCTVLLSCLPVSGEIVDLGHNREVFWDLGPIESLGGGARLTLQQPVLREVSMTYDRPWEGNVCCYHTVIQDGDLYRMYYRGSAWELPGWKGGKHAEVYCYAESKDGINWTRPNLGIFEFQGSRDNNIIWMGDGAAHNFAPFLDTNPDCKPEEKFKALGGGPLYAFASEDGKHWRKIKDEPVITKGAFDSQNLAFYDVTRKQYFSYSRLFSKGVRAIQWSVSKDFLEWTDPVELEYGADTPLEHLYTNGIHPYVRKPDIFIGFPKRFVPNRTTEYDHSGGGGLPGLSDCLFMTSRDGKVFSRFAEAIIRPGLQHDRWINRNNMAACGSVITQSDIPGNPPEISIYTTEAYYTEHPNRLRRHTFRLDGFASVKAPATGGTILTKPFTFAKTERPEPAPEGVLKVGVVKQADGSRRLKVTTPYTVVVPGTESLGKAVTFAITADHLQRSARMRLFSSYGGGPNTPGERKFILDMTVGQTSKDPVLRMWYDGVEIGIASEEFPDWAKTTLSKIAIVGTYDDGILSLYVNGKRVAQAGERGKGPLLLPVGAPRFGEDYPPTSQINEPFLGEVIDFAVIDRLLSEAEIERASKEGLKTVINTQTDKGAFFDMSGPNDMTIANRLGGEGITFGNQFWGSTMLLVNASTSVAGHVKCEIQDANGVPIPGFTLKDSIPRYGDDIDLILAWQSNVEVSELAGKPIRLLFELKDADIFAFRFGQPEQLLR